MSLQLSFRFEDNKIYVVDIGEERVEDINKVIWVLLHTLKAKSVSLDMLDITGESKT